VVEDQQGKGVRNDESAHPYRRPPQTPIACCEVRWCGEVPQERCRSLVGEIGSEVSARNGSVLWVQTWVQLKRGFSLISCARSTKVLTAHNLTILRIPYCSLADSRRQRMYRPCRSMTDHLAHTAREVCGWLGSSLPTGVSLVGQVAPKTDTHLDCPMAVQ
jgi:hypothetical protein